MDEVRIREQLISGRFQCRTERVRPRHALHPDTFGAEADRFRASAWEQRSSCQFCQQAFCGEADITALHLTRNDEWVVAHPRSCAIHLVLTEDDVARREFRVYRAQLTDAYDDHAFNPFVGEGGLALLERDGKLVIKDLSPFAWARRHEWMSDEVLAERGETREQLAAAYEADL